MCLRIRKASVFGAQKGGEEGAQRQPGRHDKLKCLTRPSRRHEYSSRCYSAMSDGGFKTWTTQAQLYLQALELLF